MKNIIEKVYSESEQSYLDFCRLQSKDSVKFNGRVVFDDGHTVIVKPKFCWRG